MSKARSCQWLLTNDRAGWHGSHCFPFLISAVFTLDDSDPVRIWSDRSLVSWSWMVGVSGCPFLFWVTFVSESSPGSQQSPSFSPILRIPPALHPANVFGGIMALRISICCWQLVAVLISSREKPPAIIWPQFQRHSPETIRPRPISRFDETKPRRFEECVLQHPILLRWPFFLSLPQAAWNRVSQIPHPKFGFLAKNWISLNLLVSLLHWPLGNEVSSS